MAGVTSSVDICNLALDYLGQGPVTNIVSPTTKEEVIMSRWYDPARRILLREYVWNFAKTRTVLAMTRVPEFDYTEAYTIPKDCLRVLSIGGTDETDYTTDFDIEGREILTNGDGTQQLNLRYTRNETDVNKFDALFINILALRIASKTAYKFSLKPSVLQAVTAQLTQDEPKAISVDGQERPLKRVQRSKYIDVRRGFFPNTADRFTRWS